MNFGSEMVDVKHVSRKNTIRRSHYQNICIQFSTVFFFMLFETSKLKWIWSKGEEG